MAISKRQNLILEKIIKEYINLAQPISSEFLEKKYDFGICPATIRTEMQKLTDKGFLCQPHTSAGRVPTDKGYRFFVDELLEEEFENFEIGDWFENEAKRSFSSSSPFANRASKGSQSGKESEALFDYARVVEDNIRFIQNLTKNLAHISGALALSYLDKEKVFWKEGWEEILKEPEFTEKDFAINFAEFLENFEENIEDFEINSGIKIYIGKENPFKKAKDFSLISSRCCLPNKKGIISLLGPKRMAYDRNISLINSLNKLLADF